MKFTTLFLFTLIMINPVKGNELENVIAHRGASFDAPENTTSSIALALELGAKIIEFDVRETSDGGLLLFHDGELKRLSGIEGIFEKLTHEDAANLDVGKWFTKGDFPDEKPPTLATAIKQCLDGGAIPLIEHKSGSAENYAAVLQEMDAVDQVIVQSFDWGFISEIRKLLPDLKVGALGKKNLTKHRKTLLDLKPDWVGWSNRDVTTNDINWLKKNGFKIAIWTVNDPTRAGTLVGLGVDRIITDRPKYVSENM